MFPEDVISAASAVLDAARARRWKLATAESCTGGLIGGALTAIAGSSDVVDRGFVSYSYASKAEMLGVDPQLIVSAGAVSEAVARAMAEGALAKSEADLALSVTGIAGPGGATPGKPVGLVQFATAVRGGLTRSRVEQFGDIGREAVRLGAVRLALALLAERLREPA